MTKTSHDDNRDHRATRRLRLALVGAWVAGAMWWWLAEPPWAGLAAATATTLALRWRFPQLLATPTTPELVTVDERGVFRQIPGRLRESVLWEDLVRVTVITTDEGPFVEDFFFLLHDRHGGGCVVSNAKAVEVGLVAALQRLGDFDNLALIEATGSTECAEFLLWDSAPQRRGAAL